MQRSNVLIVFGIVVIIVGVGILLWSNSLFPVSGEAMVAPLAGQGVAPSLEPQPVATYALSNGQPLEVQTSSTEAITGLIPDRIVIPSINLDASIIPIHFQEITIMDKVYQQWLAPDEYTVGWHDTSALLGVPGNTVLNGHHNAYGKVFANLVRLSMGDTLDVYSGEQIFHYYVVARLLLPERYRTVDQRLENARWIQPSSDERLTLITCWPADNNTHRLVIVAFPVGVPAPETTVH